MSLLGVWDTAIVILRLKPALLTGICFLVSSLSSAAPAIGDGGPRARTGADTANGPVAVATLPSAPAAQCQAWKQDAPAIASVPPPIASDDARERCAAATDELDLGTIFVDQSPVGGLRLVRHVDRATATAIADVAVAVPERENWLVRLASLSLIGLGALRARGAKLVAS